MFIVSLRVCFSNICLTGAQKPRLAHSLLPLSVSRVLEEDWDFKSTFMSFHGKQNVTVKLIREKKVAALLNMDILETDLLDR